MENTLKNCSSKYQNIYSLTSKTKMKFFRKLQICLSLQRQSRTGPLINSAPAFSIAYDESSDVNDIEQIALLCKYMNS